MLPKPESVQSIVKLIDTCRQYTQMFHSASVTRSEPYNELTEKIQQKLDQFVVELRIEVHHLDRKTFMSFIEDFDSYSFEPISSESETEALRQILDWYDQALKTPLSAEARTMIVRQHLDLQESYEQLLLVNHAA
jgi:hypothetical protein